MIISEVGISINADNKFLFYSSPSKYSNFVSVSDYYSSLRTNLSHNVFDVSAYLNHESTAKLHNQLLTILESAYDSKITRFNNLLKAWA